MGQGFQFMPGGTVAPLPDPSLFDATAINGASAAPVAQTPYDPEAIPEERPALVARTAPASLAQKPTVTASTVNPRTVIKAAKARLREIKTELRHHKALEKERAQLERMLAAAAKPLASLTPINSRRAG